jgi:hypothetical protein
MGRSPAWSFTAETARPKPGGRADAAAHVPSACIRMNLFFICVKPLLFASPRAALSHAANR